MYICESSYLNTRRSNVVLAQKMYLTSTIFMIVIFIFPYNRLKMPLNVKNLKNAPKKVRTENVYLKVETGLHVGNHPGKKMGKCIAKSEPCYR